MDACHRSTPSFDDHIRAAFGFRVVGPYGRLGTVQGHVYGTDGDLVALTVSRGLLRPRRFTIPVDDVEWVLPYGRRLLLRVSAGGDDEPVTDRDAAPRRPRAASSR